MVVCFLSMSTLSELIQKFRYVWPLLDERTRRIMAANEAVSLGFGGISVVHRACGLSRRAIAKGVREIQEGIMTSEGRIRCPGAGRKSITVSDPRLLEALEEMIDCQTRGDPQSPLRWICKSTRAIARQLGRKKHPVSHAKVAQILHDLNYSLQSNRKTEEGTDHPDRDAQFRHINAAVKKSLAQGIPVISVDTKKKELIGNYNNAGQQWVAVAALEVGVAEVCRSNRTVPFSLSFSSRHQQMEQDRTPAFFLYHVKLARRTVAGLRNDRQSHRQYDHGEGTESDV